MARKAIVRVVVGAGDADGLRSLRAALRADDFRIVGEASTVETLELIVHDTEPDVVVLDAAIPAASVLASRDAAPGAGIVVVWPEGITPVGADRHVTPSTVGTALAAAVRGAVRVRRAAGPVTPVVPAEGALAPAHEDPPRIIEDAPVSLLPSATAAAASAGDEPAIPVPGSGSTAADGSPDGQAEPRVARLPAMVAAAAAFLILVAAAFGVLRGGGQPGTAADAPGTGPSVSGPSNPGTVGGVGPTAGPTTQLGSALDGLLAPSPAGNGGAATTDHGPQSGPGDNKNGGPPPDGPKVPTTPEPRATSPGQSGDPHGHSGDPHGHTGEHGHSGDPHGHSGDPHGHSGEHGHSGTHGSAH
jgi:hypothetical protein